MSEGHPAVFLDLTRYIGRLNSGTKHEPNAREFPVYYVHIYWYINYTNPDLAVRGASPMQMTDRETGEWWMTTGTKPPEPVMCPPKVPVFPVVEVVVPVVRTAAGHDIQLDVSSDSMEDAPPSKAATSATGAKQTVSPLRPGRKRDQPSSSSTLR